MKTQYIKIGEFYRIKSSPNYGWIKPVRMLKPKEYPNTNRYIVFECEHVVNQTDVTALIRYFRPMNIIKG